MFYFTFWSTFFIFLIGVQVTESGESRVCTKADDCTGKLKCLKDITIAFDGTKKNLCGQLCENGKEAEQCGPDETCDTVKDIGDADVLSCVKKAECLKDDFCENINPKKPTCNLFTLKCFGNATEATTEKTTDSDTATASVTPTTKKTIITTTPCVDSVVGGAYDCKAHRSYCKDPEWLELMTSKCKKTCGLC